MATGVPAGQPAAPATTGTVTGHSYTAAYRYQLVIGKVGGWAIPYPLTIPQAVTGLGAVVLAMVTASWWYPLTGIAGALGVVILPIVGIRVVSRIRPEGRSVADWLYGWGVAQSQGLTGRGVRLHVGLPASSPAALAAPSAQSAPAKAKQSATAKQPAGHRSVRSSSPSTREAHPSHARNSDGVRSGVVRSGVVRTGKPRKAAALHRSGHSAKKPARRSSARSSSAKPFSARNGSFLQRLFNKPTPAPAPERVPVFDPWGMTPAQGGR